MLRRTLKFQGLLIGLALILAACDQAVVSVPSSSTAAPASPAAAANSEVEKANSLTNSPCIGVQPVAGENIQANGGGHWSAPDNVIDVNHIYCAIFTTNNGRIVAQLFPKLAPKNVNNFVFLAKNGIYENITWHRVISNFMTQSGDP